MKLLKTLLSVISAFSLLFVTTTQSFATDANNESKLSDFKGIIMNTEEYKDYSDQIKGIYAETVNENGQVTVVYALDNETTSKHTLLFTGNSNLELEQILDVTITDENITVKDLLNKVQTRAHLGYCTQHTCTKTTYVSYNPGKCPPLLGEPCKSLYLIPNYGFYLSLLCQGGVWVACNLDFNKKCLAWETSEYICSVP